MFRHFTRSGKPSDSNVVELGPKAHRPVAAQPAPDPQDQELIARLELKSHLHDILLGT